MADARVYSWGQGVGWGEGGGRPVSFLQDRNFPSSRSYNKTPKPPTLKHRPPTLNAPTQMPTHLDHEQIIQRPVFPRALPPLKLKLHKGERVEGLG